MLKGENDDEEEEEEEEKEEEQGQREMNVEEDSWVGEELTDAEGVVIGAVLLSSSLLSVPMKVSRFLFIVFVCESYYSCLNSSRFCCSLSLGDGYGYGYNCGLI